jgi:Flp pilus assembly protein CpaB
MGCTNHPYLQLRAKRNCEEHSANLTLLKIVIIRAPLAAGANLSKELISIPQFPTNSLWKETRGARENL